MFRRWFLVGVLLLASLLVVGCGIPQEQYDAVAADLNKAQQDLQSAESELATSQSKVSELTSSLEKEKSDLEAVQAQLDTVRQELTETKKVYPPRNFSSALDETSLTCTESLNRW